MRNAVLASIALLAACASRTPGPVGPIGVAPAIAGEQNTIVVHDDTLRSPTVNVAMQMVDMNMPPVRLTLQRSSTGDYFDRHAEFLMSGKWRLTTETTPRHVLDVTVR